MNNFCPACGAPISENVTKCEYCGAALNTSSNNQNTQSTQQPNGVYSNQQNNFIPAERSNWPIKNKLAAGILAILLGGIGVHKFYLGKTGAGVLYLLFSWTYIPSLLAFIEGIIILCSNDENFQTKYKCRLG